MSSSSDAPAPSGGSNPDATSEGLPGLPRSRTRRFRWWVSVATFVLGVAVGLVAIGLFSPAMPDFGVGPSASPSPSGTAEPSRVPLVAVAEVNEACLRVINDAQDLSSILTGVNELGPDVDLDRIDRLVRRLQPVEPRLNRDLAECQVDTSVSRTPSPGSSSSGSASASPTPEPTGSGSSSRSASASTPTPPPATLNDTPVPGPTVSPVR